jgi:SAM-dependent methyltransferase
VALAAAMKPAGADPTQRFGTRAQSYARARPGYPQSLVRDLARELALAPAATVVDVGCGTGLSSLPFLREGFRVIGIEPNAPMRAHAQELAHSHANFEVREGRAEGTGLAGASADLLIAAQAFHWFEIAPARAEALRILKPPTRAALIWNDRRKEGSDFARGYEALLCRYCADYVELRHQHEREDRVAQFFGHASWRRLTLEHATPLDFATLVERLDSASYVPARDDPKHPRLIEELRTLFETCSSGGVVAMQFETRILYGEIARGA